MKDEDKDIINSTMSITDRLRMQRNVNDQANELQNTIDDRRKRIDHMMVKTGREMDADQYKVEEMKDFLKENEKQIQKEGHKLLDSTNKAATEVNQIVAGYLSAKDVAKLSSLKQGTMFVAWRDQKPQENKDFKENLALIIKAKKP